MPFSPGLQSVILGLSTPQSRGPDKKGTQPPTPSAPSLSSKECDGAAVFPSPRGALPEGEGVLSFGEGVWVENGNRGSCTVAQPWTFCPWGRGVDSWFSLESGEDER